MIKNLRPNNRLYQGFTIVETLMVLAIASVILAIILIALPDLQRSARNNARHQDAYRVIAAINEYYSRNDELPTILCTSGPNQPVYFSDNSGTDSAVEFTPGFYNQTPAADAGTFTAGECTGPSATAIGGESNGYIHIIPVGAPVTFPQGGSGNDDMFDHMVVNMGSTCQGGSYSNQNSDKATFMNASASPEQFFVAILYEEGNGNWAVECFDG